MQTIKLKTHIGDDGLLTLQLPAEWSNQDLEVVVVLQPVVDDIPRDAMGYALGYFESTYGSFADFPLERPEQLHLTERDIIE